MIMIVVHVIALMSRFRSIFWARGQTCRHAYFLGPVQHQHLDHLCATPRLIWTTEFGPAYTHTSHVRTYACSDTETALSGNKECLWPFHMSRPKGHMANRTGGFTATYASILHFSLDMICEWAIIKDREDFAAYPPSPIAPRLLISYGRVEDDDTNSSRLLCRSAVSSLHLALGRLLAHLKGVSRPNSPADLTGHVWTVC